MLLVRVALMTGLCALCAAQAAQAQPSSEASGTVEEREEALISQAIELRRQGLHEAAAVVLRRAVGQRRSPRACGQLALAEQAIGRWAQAERLFREALAAMDDPWVARNRATLESSLASAASRLATVEIVGGDVGAELWVDGELAGILPMDRALRVVVGTVRVEHRSPRGPSVTRVIELGVGGRERVYFATTPANERRTDRASEPAEQQRPASVGAGALTVVADRREIALHPVTWVGVAVAGTAALGVLVPWAAGQSIATSFDAACIESAMIDRARCAARREDDQRTLDAIATATDVGWAVLAVGVVGAGVGLGVSFWGRGASVRGRF